MRFPVRLQPALAAAGFLVAVSTLTRLAFALRPEAADLGAAQLGRSLALGLGFDLVAAAYAATPFLLWLALAPDGLARRRVFRLATVVWFFVACYAALFVAVAEWLFWDEFGARFNFIAVDYLLYTHEVLGNIWESYPVGWVLAALGLGAAVVTTFLARAVFRWSAAPLGWRRGLASAAAQAALLAAVTQFVDSDLKDRAGNDIASELAANGIYSFFAANRRNELSYDRNYATLPLAEALGIVRAAFAPARWIDPESESIERAVPGTGHPRRLNVVLVSVESLGAEFVGAYGDGRGLTPNLNRLAPESLWFSKVYATGNRTVRGLEALALALPPTPGQSIVRRPNNSLLFSLGSVFEDEGYSVLFAYGGYGYFDNMNAFFDANDYRAVDRSDIPSARVEFENVWGVADEHLYDQVIDEIDREKAAHPGRPVFAHVMTTSNHRPYTYPPGRIDIAPGSGRDGAVKYSDYALGRLIERARTRPWFEDTVFVITADHGANARGTSEIPVDRYRIPLLVYSPAHIAPHRFDRLMSQIDIAPTLLGLLDFAYYTKFLGRDVLRSPPSSDRAFVANYQTLAYLRGDRIAVLRPKRKTDAFRRRPDAPDVPIADPALVREAIAFYQVASYVYGHGLYLDEEQIPPSKRASNGTNVAARNR